MSTCSVNKRLLRSGWHGANSITASSFTVVCAETTAAKQLKLVTEADTFANVRLSLISIEQLLSLDFCFHGAADLLQALVRSRDLLCFNELFQCFE